MSSPVKLAAMSDDRQGSGRSPTHGTLSSSLDDPVMLNPPLNVALDDRTDPQTANKDQSGDREGFWKRLVSCLNFKQIAIQNTCQKTLWKQIFCMFVGKEMVATVAREGDGKGVPHN